MSSNPPRGIINPVQPRGGTITISRDPLAGPPPVSYTPPIVPPPTDLVPNASQRTLTVHASSQPLHLVYGHTTVGGEFQRAIYSGGLLYLRFFCCIGPIQAINKVLIEGADVLAGAVSGVSARVYLGTSSQGPDPWLRAADPQESSGFPGIAYVVLQVDPTNTSVNPLNVVFDVSGRLVRDYSQDPTLVNRFYSTNPSWITADLLTSSWFGGRCTDASVDFAGSFLTAANDCASAYPAAPATLCFPNLSGGGGTCTAGQHEFVYTFVVAGVESNPAPVSTAATMGSTDRVAFSGVGTGPAGTTARKIYGSKGGAPGKWFLLPAGVQAAFADNVTTGATVDIGPDSGFGAQPVLNYTGPRWDFNGAILQQMSVKQATDYVRAHCMGFLVWNGGLWKFAINKKQTVAAYTFTDDPQSPVRNIIGTPRVRLKGLSEVPTKVIVGFTDASNNYQDGSAEAEVPGVAANTDSKRVRRYDLRATTTYDMAKRAANTLLNLAQADKEMTASVFFEGLQALPLERITINSVIEGLSGDWSMADTSMTGNTFTLRGDIYSDNNYSDVLNANTPPSLIGIPGSQGAPNDIPQASLSFAFPGVAYWQASRIYSGFLWPAPSWSGVNLGSFDPSKVNDGDLTLKAFDSAAAAEGILTLDCGVPRAFGKLQITTLAAPTSQQRWVVEWSDDNVVWNFA